ncbi:MAG: hypothetical protein DMG61_13280 [Acidobacteria bacterium]|nr:MAG: hypothetical protein DMG61_13280 [Acidobacteriota bacterium]
MQTYSGQPIYQPQTLYRLNAALAAFSDVYSSPSQNRSRCAYFLPQSLDRIFNPPILLLKHPLGTFVGTGAIATRAEDFILVEHPALGTG